MAPDFAADCREAVTSTDLTAGWCDLALRVQIAANGRSAQGAKACCLPIAVGMGAIGCLCVHVHFVVLQLECLVQESPLLHSPQCLACLANAQLTMAPDFAADCREAVTSTDFSARWSDLALRLQIAAKGRSAQGAEACCLPIAGGIGAIGCLRMHVHVVVLQLKCLVQESPLLHSLQCLAWLANAHANEHSCRLHRTLGNCSPCDAEAIGCTCISFSLQTTWREHVFFFF